MTTQDIQGIADQVLPGAVVRDPETFLDFLEEQGRRIQSGQDVSTLAALPAPAPQEESGGFLDFLTDSLISEGVLDTIRDQGLFGRIGGNILGELTSPLGIASTALLATGVGAPVGAALRGATAATRLAPAGRLAAGALTPVAQSARGLSPAQIVRSPGILSRSLAGEAAVAGGAIAGGGLAQEVGQVIPGPTRSVPGQIGLGLAGGALGGGLTAGGFNRVLDQDAALARAFEARDPVEEQIPELFELRKAFRAAGRVEADIAADRAAGRARQFERGRAAAEGIDDPFERTSAFRAAGGGRFVDRSRFDPLVTEVDPTSPRRGRTPRLDEITEQGAQFGLTRDLLTKVGNRAFAVHGADSAPAHTAIQGFAELMLGEVPNPSTRRLLRPVIGDAFVNQIETVISGRGRRGVQLAAEIAGIPRTLAGSFDVSSVLRQGGPLNVAHPRAAVRAWRLGFRALKNDRAAVEINQEQLNHPLVRFFNSGLEESDHIFIQNLDETGITRREENFISPVVEKVVPGVRASARFFGVNLNATRIGHLERQMHMLQTQFPELLEPENAARLVGFKRKVNEQANLLTGRGSLGFLEPRLGRSARREEALENIRTALSVGFWSPRLFLSRFQAAVEAIRSIVRSGRPVNPEAPEIRALSRQFARDIALYAGGVTAAIGSLSFLPGVSVETNPKSSDFGKVRFGNTRIDPWAGFQQIGRYATQFITGERKRATDGRIGQTDRDFVLGQFLRSKLAPGVVSIAASDLPDDSLISGLTGGRENFIGEPITGGDVTPGDAALVLSGGQLEQIPAELNVLVDQMVPLLAQDIAEALESEGLIAGTVSGISSAFGLGSVTFGENTRSEFVRDSDNAARNPRNPFF